VSCVTPAAPCFVGERWASTPVLNEGTESTSRTGPERPTVLELREPETTAVAASINFLEPSETVVKRRKQSASVESGAETAAKRGELD
jgi:hypothetical protein